MMRSRTLFLYWLVAVANWYVAHLSWCDANHCRTRLKKYHVQKFDYPFFDKDFIFCMHAQLRGSGMDCGA